MRTLIDIAEGAGDGYFAPEAHAYAEHQSRGRSRYTTIQMSPDDFLKMAQDGFAQSKYDRVASAIASGAKLRDLPFLGFVHDGDGKAYVIMHEGRHRARVLKEKGVTKMPVLFQAIEHEPGQTIRWNEVNNPGFSFFRQTWPEVLISQDMDCQIPFPVQR